MQSFSGYHSEWNLGSPGGWDYQRMAQELGRMAWQKITSRSDLKIQLDFDDPILNPVPRFGELLLRAHKHRWGKEAPFIALVAEKETIPKVGENIHFVNYLNRLEGVEACLIPPHCLEEKEGNICYRGKKITLIFLDFNNNMIVKLQKKHSLKPLLKAIQDGLVVNPRGMEPVGSKGLFELVTDTLRTKLAPSTVNRTPWTRQFYSRATTGPKGEKINDLLEWARTNWERVVLKPVHGYSGHGIFIGYKDHDKEKCIEEALKERGYIIQELVPLDLWAEAYPWLDHEEKKIFVKRWQTDFRCFVTDKGLMGFVTRFGGVPTNVGSGGGVQPTAILRSDISVKDAVDKINETIVKLGYEIVSEIQAAVDKRAVEIGSVYLLGPIMTTLRPRIVTSQHLADLKTYAERLWHDALVLEEMWTDGKLTEFVEITKEEEDIAHLAPWQGKTALIASDGLFGFGAECSL